MAVWPPTSVSLAEGVPELRDTRLALARAGDPCLQSSTAFTQYDPTPFERRADASPKSELGEGHLGREGGVVAWGRGRGAWRKGRGSWGGAVAAWGGEGGVVAWGRGEAVVQAYDPTARFARREEEREAQELLVPLIDEGSHVNIGELLGTAEA